MNMKQMGKKNKGFTLVELIVVLVILAILAAILIPALLGYIDRAREKQDILDARTLLTATQAELTEYYAAYSDTLEAGKSIIPEVPSDKGPEAKNGDIDATGTAFAKKVLATADRDNKDKKANTEDDEPYLFMIAVGSNHDKKIQGGSNNTSLHDKYTVYYALYMPSADSVPYYYYNGKWSKKNPRGEGGDKKELFTEFNYVLDGPQKDMRLQYYLISNKTGKEALKGDFWNLLKDTLDVKWNGKKK